MAKKDSLEQFRNRIRSQVGQAHVEPEEPEKKVEKLAPPVEPVTTPSAIPQPEVIPKEAPAASAPTKPQGRRRSKWNNPYPDAKPFQNTIYQTDEDVVLVKTLRLKLHFSKEWMVIKYALEKLAKDLEAQEKK